METLKKIGLIAGVSVVVSLIVVALAAPSATPVNEDNIVSRVVSILKSSLGAAAGPEDTFLDRSLNGVALRAYGANLSPGTTTVFSATAPNATTTSSLLCSVTTSTSSATVWTAAESTGGYASTTAWLDTPFTAANGGNFGWGFGTSSNSTSPAGLRVHAPNQIVNVTVQGGVSGANETTGSGGDGFQPVGHCNIIFWAYNNY